MATEATLRLAIDSSGAAAGAREFDRATDKVGRDAAATTGKVNTLSASFRGLRTAMLGIVGVAGAIATGGLAIFGKSLIDTAAAAEELESKFNVVFKGVNEQAQAIARTMADDFRRSIIDVKDAMANFQDTFVPLGYARDDALKLSEALAKLSFDLSSFYDKRQADVMRDLQSALVGQTETVRKYGVVLLEEDAKNEAYRLGLAKTGEELSAQQKILARLSLIYQGTADAQGDLIRTQDSFSNRVRELQGYLKDLRVEFGQRLIAAIDGAIQSLGGIERIQEVLKAGFISLTNVLEETIEFFGVFIGKASDAIRTFGGLREIERLADSISNAFGTLFTSILATMGELLISFGQVLKGLPAIIRQAFRGGGDEIAAMFADIFPWMDPPRTRENIAKWAQEAKKQIEVAMRDIGRDRQADLLSQVDGKPFIVAAESWTKDVRGPFKDAIDGMIADYRGLIFELSRIDARQIEADQAIQAFAGFDPAAVEKRIADILSAFNEVRKAPSYVGPLYPVDAGGPQAPNIVEQFSGGIPLPAQVPPSDFGAFVDSVKNASDVVQILGTRAKETGGFMETALAAGLYSAVEASEPLRRIYADLDDELRIASAGMYGWQESVLMAAEAANASEADLERLKQKMREIDEAAMDARFREDIGRNISSSFEEAIFSGNKLRDVLKGLLEDLARLAFQRFVGSQIIGAFGGANAKGNVFSGGTVIPFATGGVVNFPTLFPMSGGRTGLMGEAGPEAVMPLERTKDGKLGVKASGGGGGTINVVMNVNGVRDVDGFKRSERQIMDSLQRGLRRQV